MPGVVTQRVVEERIELQFIFNIDLNYAANSWYCLFDTVYGYSIGDK